jgi:hypothetical protein
MAELLRLSVANQLRGCGFSVTRNKRQKQEAGAGGEENSDIFHLSFLMMTNEK